MSTADLLLADLGEALPYASAERSFKPCYGDIGLGFGNGGGIETCYLHYNRRTIALGGAATPFLGLPGAVRSRRHGPLLVAHEHDWGSLQVAAYDRNAWIITATGQPSLTWSPQGAALSHRRWTSTGPVTFRWDALVATRDPRDPDAHAPIAFSLRVLSGRAVLGTDGQCSVEADASGRIVLALHITVLDVAHEQHQVVLDAAPEDIAGAVAKARAWWSAFVGPLSVGNANAAERKLLATAVFTLAMNAAAAPGLLAGRISLFPNRGAYPTHYQWDTCFHCLALSELAPELAVDSLLLLTENQRADGKQGQFLCSTWMRPHESQPPLIGWAGLRLVQLRRDLDLARKLLPALRANNRWWLTQRMTSLGLIGCWHPMETGWDDTPRLDQGPVVALDMNSYLILQIRACAELGRMIGDDAAAIAADEALAERLSRRLDELCWDAERGIFLDVVIADGRRLDAATPAGFLPVLAGVLDADRPRAEASIRRWLLDPSRMFGAIPFPSIAYDHPAYIPVGPGACWRGPHWPPIAWFMLDILDHFGFAAESRAAAERMWAMMVADGELHEFFDSRTGAGAGSPQQGWTAAIAIALQRRLAGGRDGRAPGGHW
ncbi:hypothetical protein LBMAG53_19280 [Planctomycetota bacterium]|nr:hypothetical protein LBMAG53_19280 [Planctomycetota bacterium]